MTIILQRTSQQTLRRTYVRRNLKYSSIFLDLFLSISFSKKVNYLSNFRLTLDGLGHAAELLDLLDVGPGAACDLVGEALDIVRAAPRVNLLADVGLLLDVLPVRRKRRLRRR